MSNQLDIPFERGKPFTGEEAAARFVEPTVTMYAEFGRYVAVMLGVAPDWPDAEDIVNNIDDWLGEHWGYAQHPANESITGEWERIRDEVEHGRERARAAAKEEMDRESTTDAP